VLETDILVVGGGPAGLMAAAQLSAKHSVTLIERGRLGQTSKCWVTTARRLRKHGLEHCVLSTPHTMTAGTFLGAHISVHGDFVVVDDQKVLNTLLERCRVNGVRLSENSSLLNLSWTDKRVRAQTATDQSFLARLVIDASGGMSPVASTFRLNRIDGFYSVYGALLQGIELHSSEIVLGYVGQLGDPPPILEIFPTGDDSAYCVLFIYSRSLVAPQALAAAFEDHCRCNPYFVMTPKTVRAAEKAGAIPIGRRTRRKLPGVVAFGEAGLIQPPLMGTAFNEMLEHADSLCHQMSQALESSSSGIVFARQVFPFRKSCQDRVQLPIVRTILSGNVERFDQMLKAMSRFPKDLLFNFFSNELTWAQLSSVALGLPLFLLLDAARARLKRGS
jgi:2-polyprenyl-6-methoxyphenol hydroxylase-like FAD-dependent oxidoreductase